MTENLTLAYAERYLRRRRVTTDGGARLLIDLPEARSLRDGEVVETVDGPALTVRAAPEALLEVSGPELARYAWHIGNRHTPCRIEPDRLLIAEDAVLANMLRGLGASVRAVTAPFEPEGGAYGHGRAHGHAHSHDPHHDPDAQMRVGLARP